MSTSDGPIDETASSAETNKFAIVVGVNNSSALPPNWETIRHAERDAEEMAFYLKQSACNFKLVKPVLLGKEATASHIRRAMLDLVIGRTQQDLLLFYFSGHAQPINDDIYFVTDDFDKVKVKFDPGGYISMRWLHETLYQSESVEAGCVLIILDCCYAGNMAQVDSDLLHKNFQKILDAWDKGPGGKAQKNRSRLILAATGYDIKALETKGHGLMTEYLLEAFRGDKDDQDRAYDDKGHVDIYSLSKYVQNKVPKEQLATLSGKLTGTWILAHHRDLSEAFLKSQENSKIDDMHKVIMGAAGSYKGPAGIQHSQPFDYSVCSGASFDDLDREKIAEFFRQERSQKKAVLHSGSSDQAKLLQIGLMQKSYPTYGALLCFGQEPPQWVSGARTRCIRWRGNNNLFGFQNSQFYEEGLLKQFESSCEFLQRYLDLGREINSEGSKERWEIPFVVLREALANALIHREYVNRTDWIQVDVFDDRIEINSPGGLPSPMTLAQFEAKHGSRPRNSQIANIFYLYGYVEEAGSGIPRMKHFMKEAGLPEPKFDVSGVSGDETFTVVLYRPKQASLESEQILMPIWNVPYRRNQFFTGREDILNYLHDTLRAGKTAALTQPQAISGLGGIGKTQTAIEYAYRYRGDYQTTLWVTADSRESIVSDFRAIASFLNLPEKNAQDQSLIITAVKHWLETHTNWLMIFDNADDLQIAYDFLPIGGKGHILLTTRAQSMRKLAQRVEIEKMGLEEGSLFLLRRANIIAPDASLDTASIADRAKAREIVQVVDGLPLALDQAGAFIEETAISLFDYLNFYQIQRTELLKERGGLVADHPEPVATTWSLAFEKVEKANPAAAELLRLCAFLFPDAIPEEIITEGAPELGPVLHPVATDWVKLNKAIVELLKYSLVHRDPSVKTLSVHRLVQAVLKDGMNENTQQQWAERAVRAVNRAFPDVGVSTWPECQRLLPHAQVCAVLIAQWHMEFEEAAQLLNQAGQYLQARAQYAEAEPLYQRALEIREKTLGLKHPDVAQSLNNLARLYDAQDQYAEAEPLYQRALRIDEQVLGPEHPDLAIDLNNLALLYYAQGKYAQAEPLYQRALTIQEKTLGLEHPDVATSLNNLAGLYYAQGAYAQAEPLYKRALAILQKALGENHPNVAIVLGNYATLLRGTKRGDEATELEAGVRKIAEKIEHQDML